MLARGRQLLRSKFASLCFLTWYVHRYFIIFCDWNAPTSFGYIQHPARTLCKRSRKRSQSTLRVVARKTLPISLTQKSRFWLASWPFYESCTPSINHLRINRYVDQSSFRAYDIGRVPRLVAVFSQSLWTLYSSEGLHLDVIYCLHPFKFPVALTKVLATNKPGQRAI